MTDELVHKPAIWTEASQRSTAGRARGFAEHSAAEIAEIKAQYYAMVSLVDDEVGRILVTLDERGLTENTLVIFTSDHGELLGDLQMLLKGPMMFDCSVRVPLLVRWPGRVPAGRVLDDLVQWIDLAPTVLGAAGLTEVLPRAQGQSLLPLLFDGDSWRPRGWAISEYRNSGAPYDPPVHTTMLRHGTSKLVVHHGPPATSRARDGELYDLAADPAELVNLWRDPAAAGLRLQMLDLLLDVLAATEDRSSPACLCSERQSARHATRERRSAGRSPPLARPLIGVEPADRSASPGRLAWRVADRGGGARSRRAAPGRSRLASAFHGVGDTGRWVWRKCPSGAGNLGLLRVQAHAREGTSKVKRNQGSQSSGQGSARTGPGWSPMPVWGCCGSWLRRAVRRRGERAPRRLRSSSGC